MLGAPDTLILGGSTLICGGSKVILGAFTLMLGGPLTLILGGPLTLMLGGSTLIAGLTWIDGPPEKSSSSSSGKLIFGSAFLPSRGDGLSTVIDDVLDDAGGVRRNCSGLCVVTRGDCGCGSEREGGGGRSSRSSHCPGIRLAGEDDLDREAEYDCACIMDR